VENVKTLKRKECYVLDSANNIFFDVDDTLIMWDHKISDNFRLIKVEDPNMPGHMMTFLPHLSHINLLKRNYNQGRIVIVWSAAGSKWASTIVKALKIEEFVTLILEKPKMYCDDTPIEHWAPQRIYLNKDVEGNK